MMPLYCMEKKGLQTMLETSNRCYRLPSQYFFREKVIEYLYSKMVGIVGFSQKEANYFS